MRHIKDLPSLSVLQEYFYVDPICNTLKWNADRGGRKKGDSAGTINDYGHPVVSVDGQKYKVSRIIWKMYHREDPGGPIFHIDEDRENNDINNLYLKPRFDNIP